MNQGQEQFLNFIIERVNEDKVEEAKSLLAENFKKQEEGTFTREDITNFGPKIIALIKPDKVEEVQTAMNHFAGAFKK